MAIRRFWTAGVIALLLLVVAHSLQAAVLRGIVLDQETGEPLAGTNLQIEGTHLGSSSDLDGHFLLRLIPAGEHTLSVTHVGYDPLQLPLILTASGDTTLTLSLVPDIHNLEPVVYTATRTLQRLKDVPVPTEVVGRQEIEQTAATTAGEALSNEIGVDIRDDFSGRGISIQGVDPDRVLVLLNGNRVVGRINGSIDLDQISTLGVKQIEVVKGAVSTLYGSEAIGGVVNIITDAPVDPLQIRLDMNGGGFVPDRGKSAISYSPSLDLGWRKGRYALRGGVRYRSNDRMDIDPDSPETEGVEATDRINAHGSAEIELSDETSLLLNGELMQEAKEWVEESGLQSVEVYFDDEESNRRYDLSAELKGQPDWTDLYSIRLYHTISRHDWDKYTLRTHRLANYSQNNEDYTQVSFQLTRTFGAWHRVVVGGDAYRWDVDAFSDMGSYRSNISTRFHAWDLFAQDEWKVAGQWTLVPGLRFESHDLYASHISPKIAARWEPRHDWILRASVGQGYRAPSSKELYYVFNHAAAGYVVIGNENLEPEKSFSANLSVEHTYADRSVSRLAFFFNDLTNMIEYHLIDRTQDLPVGIYRYDNVISAWIGGVEVQRSTRLGDDVEWEVAYGYTESRDRATDKRLLRTPAHTARTSVTWTPGRNTVRIWGRFVSPALFTDKFTNGDLTSDRWTDPYSQWNLVVSRDIGSGMNLYLKGENLFDTTNPEYGPYQGRILLAGWSWNYSGQ